MTAAIICMGLGAICIVAALNEWRKDRRMRAAGHRTDGVVIDLFWSVGHAYPVFQFQTPDGRTFEVQDQFGTGPAMYRVGAPVRVLYDPANPEGARVDRAAFGGIRTVFILLFGLGFAVLGVWLARNSH